MRKKQLFALFSSHTTVENTDKRPLYTKRRREPVFATIKNPKKEYC